MHLAKRQMRMPTTVALAAAQNSADCYMIRDYGRRYWLAKA